MKKWQFLLFSFYLFFNEKGAPFHFKIANQLTTQKIHTWIFLAFLLDFKILVHLEKIFSGCAQLSLETDILVTTKRARVTFRNESENTRESRFTNQRSASNERRRRDHVSWYHEFSVFVDL